MIYRPQFAFHVAPPGFRDEQFHYSFDKENVPILNTAIGAGLSVNNIVCQLQNDAEFILRSLKIQGVSSSVSSLLVTIRDPYGNFLSAVPLPIGNYASGGGAVSVGRMDVPFEDQIVCPIGGFFEVFLTNLTLGNVNPPAFSFYGVNRRPLERAA